MIGIKHRRVLVADDDQQVLQLIALLVEQEGYEALQARDGTEALHLAEANCVDLLITDAEMPGMSGPELISAVKERGLIQRSLLVTGNAAALDGFNDLGSQIPLLAKPFNSRQLLGKIEAILSD